MPENAAGCHAKMKAQERETEKFRLEGKRPVAVAENFGEGRDELTEIVGGKNRRACEAVSPLKRTQLKGHGEKCGIQINRQGKIPLKGKKPHDKGTGGIHQKSQPFHIEPCVLGKKSDQKNRQHIQKSPEDMEQKRRPVSAKGSQNDVDKI